ncbi:uncharacterized protein [Musca autumnalis]|uniref:uncharacterized protein n=1 Tax=Musca autumnalis TaxID=221902 RepID=UPI003CED20E8
MADIDGTDGTMVPNSLIVCRVDSDKPEEQMRKTVRRKPRVKNVETEGGNMTNACESSGEAMELGEQESGSVKAVHLYQQRAESSFIFVISLQCLLFAVVLYVSTTSVYLIWIAETFIVLLITSAVDLRISTWVADCRTNLAIGVYTAKSLNKT